MRKLRKFVALDGWERAALLEAAVLTLLAAAGLRMFGMQACLRLAARALRPPRPETRPAEDPARIAELATVAAPIVRLAPSCLTRALALWAMLRRRGIPSCLRIGVRKRGEEFQAHAWVEVRGRILTDRPDVGGDFRTLFSVEAGL